MKDAKEWVQRHAEALRMCSVEPGMYEAAVRAIQADARADMRERCAAEAERFLSPADAARLVGKRLRALPLEES